MFVFLRRDVLDLNVADLIIFDCDGTLVDSEHLYNSITSELLNEIGYDEYTPALCMELFTGQSWSTIRTTLEARHGQKMPDDIIERYIRIANTKMDHDFEATPYADDVLKTLSVGRKICVASNGERGNVIKSLKITGLFHHFGEKHIFSKIQVARPKPAPDLFLFACEQMGIAPDKTLIVEDSVAGVEAACAAGIAVLGFTGAAHVPEKQALALKNAGASVIIESLIHIRDHIIS